jgi:hypothetical protein
MPHTRLEPCMQVRGEPPRRFEVAQEVHHRRRAKLVRHDIVTEEWLATEQGIKVSVMHDTARPVMR